MSHDIVRTICYKNYKTLQNGEGMLFPCQIPLVGEHVGIAANGRNNQLTLCEFEVYGVPIHDSMFNLYLHVHLLACFLI